MANASLRLFCALVIGVVIGWAGEYLVASSQFKLLHELSYLRHAVDARSDALALDEIKTHQYAQAIRRLEGRLLTALLPLGDYENVVPLDRREPQIYSAVSVVRDYVKGHPETILPGPAASILDSLAAKDVP